jgi:hypothetical protein
VSRTTTLTGKPTIKAQRESGIAEVGLKLFHIVLPWLTWLLYTLVALGLLIADHFDHLTLVTGVIVLVAACVIAGFDFYLRCHRQSWAGRWLGPVTSVLSGVFLACFLWTGFASLTAIFYAASGVVACIGWDIWLTVGDHRDLAATFAATAASAGLDGAQLVGVRKTYPGHRADLASAALRTPKTRRGRRGGDGGRAAGIPPVIEAGIKYPVDPAMTTEEAGDQVGNLEAANGWPAGSVSLTSHAPDAGYGKVRITEPATLDAAPIPWPGPFAPGADMSTPFRLAQRQDGVPLLYPRLPVHHVRVTGKTGSAKTMGYAWNLLAEGITRDGYAAVAADVVKGEQFLGALRPALHRFEPTGEGAVALLAGLHRARLARCNWLGSHGYTEWVPGCGLSFVDCLLEEAAGILKLLGTTKPEIERGLMPLAWWVEDVNSSRSAGMAWCASYQKPDKTQAASTVARSQMGHVCFGVAEKADLDFGLSDLQRERGCRPNLWQATYPGKAFIDTETIPEDVKTMPVRFYNWGPGTQRIADYAREFPASMRPLDPVTEDALFTVPPGNASAAFPVMPGYQSPASRPGRMPGNGGSPGQPSEAGSLRKRPSQQQAEKIIRGQILDWRDKGGLRFFGINDLKGVLARVQRVRGWAYTQCELMASEGLVELINVEPKRWEILPAPDRTVASERDAEDSEDAAESADAETGE